MESWKNNKKLSIEKTGEFYLFKAYDRLNDVDVKASMPADTMGYLKQILPSFIGSNLTKKRERKSSIKFHLFQGYSVPEAVYHGISLGDINFLIKTMLQNQEKHPDEKVYTDLKTMKELIEKNRRKTIDEILNQTVTSVPLIEKFSKSKKDEEVIFTRVLIAYNTNGKNGFSVCIKNVKNSESEGTPDFHICNKDNKSVCITFSEEEFFTLLQNVVV